MNTKLLIQNLQMHEGLIMLLIYNSDKFGIESINPIEIDI